MSMLDYAPFERVWQQITVDVDGENVPVDVYACVDYCDEGSEPLYGGPREDWDDGVHGSVEFTVYYTCGDLAEDHIAELVDQSAVYDEYIAQRDWAERP